MPLQLTLRIDVPRPNVTFLFSGNALPGCAASVKTRNKIRIQVEALFAFMLGTYLDFM